MRVNNLPRVVAGVGTCDLSLRFRVSDVIIITPISLIVGISYKNYTAGMLDILKNPADALFLVDCIFK